MRRTWLFVPGADEAAQAAAVRWAQRKESARLDGALIEVPIYAAAKRLLDSAARTPPRKQRTRG